MCKFQPVVKQPDDENMQIDLLLSPLACLLSGLQQVAQHLSDQRDLGKST